MADIVIYDVVPRAGVIDLGKQVEGLVTRVVLPNIRRGAGTVQLVHQRSDDQEPYPVPVTEDGDKVYWIVTRSDTAFPGRGQAELQWLGENGEVAKSVTYQTNTTRSMAEPGSVPDEPLKPYTQAVARDAQAAKNAAASATEAARSAEASAGQAGLSADNAAKTLKKLEDGIASGDFRGEKGDKGDKGDRGEVGPAGDTTAADAAAAAAKAAAQEARTAAVQAAESVAGLADDLTALKAETITLKAETTRTARSLDYLWKKSKGIVYDTETVTGAGSSVTVPSGAMDYAALRKLGGMSQRGEENNVLIDATVDEVKVTGKNVLPLVFVADSQFVLVSSPTVVISNTTGNRIYPVTKWYTLPAGTYVTIASDKKSEIYVQTHGSDYSHQINSSNNLISFDVPTPVRYLFVCPAGRTVSTAIQTVRGTTPDPNYAPYRLDTYPIPQAIRDMCPDYGQGAAESYNYIDFAAKTYYHVGSMSQDGTWTALETPEIIDLSAVWPDDDFGVLRVEAGGTIGLHYPALDDGFELAVPSETEIMVDVAKVVETDG